MDEFESCPRMISKEDLIAGLKAGRTACIDRKDAPELQDLLALEREGLVSSEVVEIDEQSTVRKFRWYDAALKSAGKESI